jgi:ribosomal protein S15P/S13E
MMVKKAEKIKEKTSEVIEEKLEKKKSKLSQADYEKKVLELADKGLTSEKIGEELKKQGIHPKEFENKISKILGDKYINPDLKNVESKLERIKTHFAKNKQDKRAMREKDRIFAQLRKLKKYFKV